MEVLLKMPNALKFEKKSFKGGMSNCAKDSWVSFPVGRDEEWLEFGAVHAHIREIQLKALLNATDRVSHVKGRLTSWRPVAGDAAVRHLRGKL